MSAYKRIELKLMDKELIVKALLAAEWRPGQFWTEDMIEVHDEPVNLVGYTNDGRPMQANIIVRKKHIPGSYNDLGFVYNKEKDSYDMLVSDFGIGNNLGQKWLDGLGLSYGKEAVMDTCSKSGISESDIEWVVNDDGSINFEINVGDNGAHSFGGNF